MRSRPSARQGPQSSGASSGNPPPIFLPRLYLSRKRSYLALSISFPEGDLRRLLFLNGIRAFEAAARGGSFAAAGAELNVSPAAISRMVHLLEERLRGGVVQRQGQRPGAAA